MFGISTQEFLVIMGVALVVIGPKKLPEMARTLGRLLGEVKKTTDDFKQTLEQDETIAAAKKTFDDAVSEGMKVMRQGMDEAETGQADAAPSSPHNDIDPAAAVQAAPAAEPTSGQASGEATLAATDKPA